MKRKLRVPLLLLGAYLIFMGIAEIIMSRWTEPPETARRLLGIVFTCLGLAALGDGCRDFLTPRKKQIEPSQPRQAILTDVDGKRRSDVSREALREQLSLLAERGASFSLELLPVPEVPDLGWMERVLCAWEETLRVSALLVTGEGACIALERSGLPMDRAEAVLAGILDGTEDFAGWEPGDWPHPEREEAPGGLLVLFGDSWYERFPFFAERDLELAVEGLVQEKYTKVELYQGEWRYLVFPEYQEEQMSDPPKIFLQMIRLLGNHSAVYEKQGSVSQVQAWLVELYQDGWNPFGWTEKTH